MKFGQHRIWGVKNLNIIPDINSILQLKRQRQSATKKKS